MTRAQFQVSLYQANEASYLFVPPGWRRDRSKRLVIVNHGANGNCLSAGSGNGGIFNLLAAISDQLGLPVLSIDGGCSVGTVYGTGVVGPAQNTWGNAAAMTAIDAAVNWATAASGKPAGMTAYDVVPGGLGPVIMIGVSMGGASTLNYAARNPAKVRAILGIVPVADVNDVYTNNRGGWAADIDLAYAGNWTANGQGAAPSYNPASNIPGALKALPLSMYYSAGDATVLGAAVNNYAALYGANSSVSVIPGAPIHGASVNALANDADSMRNLLQFIAANA